MLLAKILLPDVVAAVVDRGKEGSARRNALFGRLMLVTVEQIECGR